MNDIKKEFYNLYWEKDTTEKSLFKWVEQKLKEEYKRGVSDEIECVETSGEHFDLQKKLKKTRKVN